jgi:PBSX family phage portal protein
MARIKPKTLRPYADKLAYVVKTTPTSRQIKDPFAALYRAGGAIEPPLPPERLLLLVEENAVHAACVKAKADDAVGRGWRLEGEEVEGYDEVAGILEDITPDWTFAELLSAAAWELEAVGWAAWEVVRQGGKVAAIYPMPAHTIRATPDPKIYVQMVGFEKREFPIFGEGDDPDGSEIILFRYYSPRSLYYGVPKWISAIPAIAELTAIREYNVSWFASGGTADRIILVKSSSITEADELVEQVRTALRDASGRGHVSIVLSGREDTSIDVEFLSQEVGRREGQFIRRREDLIKEILIAHGVPPYRIGWAELGSLGGSAAAEMVAAYRTGVVEPLQTIFENRLNQTLFGDKGLNLKGRWVLEDLSFEETEMNLKMAIEGIEHGIFTPNEARQLLGWDLAESDELDRHYMAQNLTPLGPSSQVKEAVDVLKEFRSALEAVIKSEETADKNDVD